MKALLNGIVGAVFLFVASPSPAPVEVGNGGDAVVCRAQAGSPFEGYYSLDYLLTYRQTGGLAAVPSLDESLIRIGENIREKLPEFSAQFTEFKDLLRSSDFRFNRIWEEAAFGLIDIRDEQIVGLLPSNCKTGNQYSIVQAVIRQSAGPGVPPGKIVYRYVPSVFSELEQSAPLQLSFLVVHEWLWDIVTDVETNRRLNRFLHSESFATLGTDDVRRTVEGMGIPLQGDLGPNQLILKAGGEGACGLYQGRLTCFGGATYARSLANFTEAPTDFALTDGNQLCVLIRNSVQCYGQNAQGLGLTSVPSLVRPKALVAGKDFVCAKDMMGWKCWGMQQFAVPEIVLGFDTGWQSICYLKANGAVKCENEDFPEPRFPAPFQLPVRPHAKKLTTGEHFGCVLDRDGAVSCFGDNSEGQSEAPAALKFTGVAAGGRHVCGITSFDDVYCWGDHLGFRGMPSLSHPTQIISGRQFSCALDDHGVSCWGDGVAQMNMVIPAEFRW